MENVQTLGATVLVAADLTSLPQKERPSSSAGRRATGPSMAVEICGPAGDVQRHDGRHEVGADRRDGADNPVIRVCRWSARRHREKRG